MPSLLTMVACNVGISVLYREHGKISEDLVAFVRLKEARMFNRYLIWTQQDNPCLNTVIGVARDLFKVDRE